MKKIHATAHWEQQKGTHEQAAKYCKKDGDFWEKGELPKQGKRTDLEAVAESVRNGASLQEVAEEHPETYVRYHKGLTALKYQMMKHRTEEPDVYWLWGTTGVGKTRTAMDDKNGTISIYMKDETKWWDGYDQQDRIVIDDFDGSWPFRNLLRLLDRYQNQGQTKFGYLKINSKEIYITAEHPPSFYWSGSQLKQIMRRLKVCTEVKCTEVEGNTMPQLSV